jgi:phosphocarrier protein
MGAKIRKGSTLKIRAEGSHADDAIKALRDLVERNFDEEKKHGKTV